MNNTKYSNKEKKPNRVRRKTRNVRNGRDFTMSRELQGNNICRDREVGWIVFDPTNLRMFDAANPFFAATLKTNDAGSPNATYFVAESGQGWIRASSTYNSYRVLKTCVNIAIVANEPTVPCTFGLGYNDILPVVASYADAQAIVARKPSYGPVIVGQTTGTSRVKIPPLWIKNANIVGNKKEYLSEQGYSGTTGTGGTSVSPTQFTYVTLVALAFNSATNLTNGLFVSLSYSCFCEFYSRKQKI